jgi:mono/diheme cytochrome c family protein
MGSAALLLLGMLLLVQQTGLAAAAPDQQDGALPPSVRAGQPLYAENCAPCHGDAGWGDGPTAVDLPEGATALADPTIARLATPAAWFEVVKEGRMALYMPPWKNRLSDQQIWDVVAYSLFLQTGGAELAQGAVVWEEQCADCHGSDGAGAGPQAVASGLTMPDLTDGAFTASRSLTDWYTVTSQGQDAMPGFAGTLSEEEIWAAVQVARTFTVPPMSATAELTGTTALTGTGRLTGQVSNGTTGRPVTATVTLNTFENFEPLATQQVQTGPDGTFVFEDLPTGSQYVYLASTLYGDNSFGSEIVSFPAGETELATTLTIYESSATPGEIRVNLAQWFVDSHQGALLIGELYRFDHDSDRVYVGSEEVAPGQNAVLRFNLPEGATSVVLDGGEIGGRFVRTAEGVVDTQPLLPGGTQVLLRYLLPYDGTKAEFAHSVPYPVDRLNVLVVDGPAVTADLQSLGPQTVADQQWNSFEATNLPAGEPVSLRLSDLARAQSAVVAPPGASDAVFAHNPTLLFGIGAAALVAILGVFGAYLLFRPKASVTVEATPSVADAPAVDVDPATERQRLLASIAQLDDRYASGGLDEESYQRARAAQKRSLLVVTGARSETGPSGEAQPETGASDEERLER